jgi:hypothetical protein
LGPVVAEGERVPVQGHEAHEVRDRVRVQPDRGDAVEVAPAGSLILARGTGQERHLGIGT